MRFLFAPFILVVLPITLTEVHLLVLAIPPRTVALTLSIFGRFLPICHVFSSPSASSLEVLSDRSVFTSRFRLLLVKFIRKIPQAEPLCVPRNVVAFNGPNIISYEAETEAVAALSHQPFLLSFTPSYSSGRMPQPPAQCSNWKPTKDYFLTLIYDNAIVQFRSW